MLLQEFEVSAFNRYEHLVGSRLVIFEDYSTALGQVIEKLLGRRLPDRTPVL